MHLFFWGWLATLFSGLFLNTWLPWWSPLVLLLLLGLWQGRSGWGAFTAGFWAVGLAWLLMALSVHLRHAHLGGDLPERMARLIIQPLLGTGDAYFWYPVLLLLGGLLGGLAALSGQRLRVALSLA